MKLPRLLPALSFLVLTATASAHPGHDGDHGLTWDFSHVVNHPGATGLWLAVFALSVWMIGQQIRAERRVARQSLRASQDRRGN